jgi:GT2 family glycosyltransferase
MITIENKSPLTFCISTYNNLEYLKLAVHSVRKNSFFSDAPFIIHAENCNDGTDEWLEQNAEQYNLTYFVDKNEVPVGIGGGMNFCADRVETEYIMFLHSDFYVGKHWDKALLDVIERYPNEKLWVSSHRIEPNMFNNPSSRPGTHIIDKDILGAYHHDFRADIFEEYAIEFMQSNHAYEIPKGEGVSGLIHKSDWDEIGGNDPIFSPASWDDMDLFLRMLQNGFKFILTGSSLVWHFGARGSHRLEMFEGKSDPRQIEAEQKNIKKWLDKWGSFPTFNEVGMINGLKDA